LQDALSGPFRHSDPGQTLLGAEFQKPLSNFLHLSRPPGQGKKNNQLFPRIAFDPALSYRKVFVIFYPISKLVYGQTQAA
jgi:hypothetical protein